MRQIGRMCANCNYSKQNDMCFSRCFQMISECIVATRPYLPPLLKEKRSKARRVFRCFLRLGRLKLTLECQQRRNTWNGLPGPIQITSGRNLRLHGSLVNSLGTCQQLWKCQAPFLDMGTCSASIRQRFKLEPLGDGIFLFRSWKLCRITPWFYSSSYNVFFTISRMICGKPRVYNRGLVLARLQMQLQDVGPLKLPWSDCMLGPGQKVTASWLKCTLYTCQIMPTYEPEKNHRSGLFLELVRYFYPFFFSGYLSTRIQCMNWM